MEKRWLFSVVIFAFALALIAGTAPAYGQNSSEGKQEKSAPPANQEIAEKPGNDHPETFKEDARKTMRDLNRQIRVLGKKAKSQWEGAETGAKEAWQDVKVKQKTAKKQVKELGSASKETWEQSKSKTKDALEDLKKSFEKAKAYFK